MDRYTVGLICAGGSGAPLLRRLLDAPFVDVVGVADFDEGSPGIEMAREAKVPVVDHFLDLVEHGSGIDILIDVSGSQKVGDEVRRFLHFCGNTHTVFVHERVALLIMSLCAGSRTQAPLENMTRY
ncbi:hypothetical protein [Paludibacterium yongneupense]|uniref:hypothetical protein n=1 Tax=Paludibacterium yongneupense TaxID=400061 RepID=UPI0004121CE0|nr:hypothetical protein [Paludibacterium yongneupense]